MKLDKLVLSNGYVAYPDSVDHILTVTDIGELRNDKGFSFMIRWDPVYQTAGIKYFWFKSKRSCSYNRNKLLNWIDEVKRMNAEDIRRTECEAAHWRIE